MSAETSTNTLGATNHSNKEREELDFYQTPQYAVDSLIGAFPAFDPERKPYIWEPTAGNGAISEWFESAGFRVWKSDIAERKLKLDERLDYLQEESSCRPPGDYVVVMNPPYEFATEFILRTLEFVKPRWLCVFLPVRYLEGQKRFDQIYSRFVPCSVLMYKRRLGCYRESDKEAGKATDRGIASAVAYSWICWDRDTMSKPGTETVLKWV